MVGSYTSWSLFGAAIKQRSKMWFGSNEIGDVSQLQSVNPPPRVVRCNSTLLYHRVRTLGSLIRLCGFDTQILSPTIKSA